MAEELTIQRDTKGSDTCKCRDALGFKIFVYNKDMFLFSTTGTHKCCKCHFLIFRVPQIKCLNRTKVCIAEKTQGQEIKCFFVMSVN